MTPVAEQLPVIRSNRPGAFVVRGAAGSGKTTSALLRLRFLVNTWLERRERLGLGDPVRVLTLTFNKTLKGYIEELARTQVSGSADLDLTISTFGKWGWHLTRPNLVDDDVRVAKIRELSASLALAEDFIVEELDYAIGRFLPENLGQYTTLRRIGRGNSPRVNRQQFMDVVINPYLAWKLENGYHDWNDVAVQIARRRIGAGYDVIVADEVQDFSANALRAIRAQLADDHSATFVLDQAQQIYARGFTWQEVGITVEPRNSVRLTINHRNTREIAAFAAPLLTGIEISDDGTMPDLRRCEPGKFRPLILQGRYTKQIARAIEIINERVNLNTETVAFMHPWQYFGQIIPALVEAGIPFVEITRNGDWPQGEEQVALTTMHSSKGLEFDHVFVLGMNQRFLRHGADSDDATLETLRRLVAMAVGRARKAVVLGYLPAEKSDLIDYLDPATYDSETV